jgi:hypothetical protein
MSAGDPAPASWLATQQWLDDLDRDSAPGATADGHRHRDGPRDSHFDHFDGPEPTDLDVGDIDEPDPAEAYGVDAAQPAAVDLDEPFAGEPKPDDTDRDPHTTAHLDDADSAGLDLHSSDRQHVETQDDSADARGPTRAPGDPARFNKSVAVGFAAAILVATIVVTATLLGMRTDPTVREPPGASTTQISVAAAPPPPPADDGGDAPIPYTASSSCPPGSTAAQSVAGSDPTRAWVCVRNGADGQVLRIELGRPMVVTAISLSPGWVGADATGADQWLQHRVLTRVQWILFNGNENPTVVPQKTGNVRGEAVQPMPTGGVLASRITMIVQQTARAPADTGPPASAAPAPGGLLDDVIGAPLGPLPTVETGAAPPPGLPEQDPTDPADNTFAVSAIKILGHPPR